MTPMRPRQMYRSGAVAIALPQPTSWARFEVTLENTRNSLFIIGYELALRVLILARRWNY